LTKLNGLIQFLTHLLRKFGFFLFRDINGLGVLAPGLMGSGWDGNGKMIVRIYHAQPKASFFSG
jgi:hypothetical protein